MDYGKYCYNVIQELEARIKVIEKELTAVKTRLDALEDEGE